MPAIKFEAYDDSLYWQRGDEVRCYAFDENSEDMLFRASMIEVFGVNIYWCEIPFIFINSNKEDKTVKSNIMN